MTPPATQAIDWDVPARLLYEPRGGLPSFIDERQMIMEALMASRARGSTQWGMRAATADALLALARLHYRHGMAPEGLSILEGLETANLSDDQGLQRAVLELALGLIDTRREAVLTDRAQAMLGPEMSDWPDQQMFKALDAVHRLRFREAAEDLPELRDRLTRLPKSYQAAVLPGALEAAIATRQWRVARDFALEFRKHTALQDSGAFHYLLGRAAEAGEDMLAAFDSYVLAGETHDIYGHRARTAVIALGLEQDFLSIEEARILLQRESQIWRGDDYALAVLKDLAALNQADEDRVGAIHTLGTIMDRFPETVDAGLARQKARSLIAEVYEAGATGKMPLGDFLQAHRVIAPDFRFEAGFDAQAERFANRFLAVGSTLVAAQEYEAVHDYLAVARDLGLATVEDERLDELRLKQARALTLGGQYDTALAVLRDPMASGIAELADDRAQLLAQLYADTGQSAAVLETSISHPNVAFLRVKADAYFDRGDWAMAQETYQQIWDELGNELPLEDGIQFLLSAYRSNDLSTTATLTKAFPDLTTIPQWSAIADGLVDPAAELWPLRSDTARKRMDTASKALEDVQTAVPGTN
ncbi:hypothetical protein [Pseudooceanicola sp.]|uniref:hypothetical protein n=3 Tax=Pseudooceanicola sp. TaxID=1914328 RepID=UPI0035C778D4